MENLLALIEITKSKRSLLSNMMKLEKDNQMDTPEFNDLIASYRLTCQVYDKKLRLLSEEDRSELISKIGLLNPELLKLLSLQELLNLTTNSHYTVLTRIILDLANVSLIKFYALNDSCNGLPKSLLHFLGLSSNDMDDKSTNADTVNKYMNQDFTNLLFSIINEKIEVETDCEYRNLLFECKYRLILLFSSLENRTLMTNFYVPETIKLVDVITIETTGITVDEYIKSFDSSIVHTIMAIIKKSIFYNKDDYFVLDLILLETLINLLSDEEYVEIIENEITAEMTCLSKENVKKTQSILNLLERKKNINNKSTRQYIKI